MGLKLAKQDEFANCEIGNSGMFLRSGTKAMAVNQGGSFIVNVDETCVAVGQ
jgi:hypothetical protein